MCVCVLCEKVIVSGFKSMAAYVVRRKLLFVRQKAYEERETTMRDTTSVKIFSPSARPNNVRRPLTTYVRLRLIRVTRMSITV